jgi:cytochrome c553
MGARLEKFSNATRNNPHLKLGMFKEQPSQSNDTRMSVAKYFGEQSATMPKGGIRAAEGKRIYENGLAAENVVACSLCHGPNGEGHNTAPRIAGQHADYLTAQLQLFNIKFREHVLMNPNTEKMSRNTMGALISYLAND